MSAQFLSTALYREVHPEFFRVLSGAKTGRLYVDALDALERAAAQRAQAWNAKTRSH